MNNATANSSSNPAFTAAELARRWGINASVARTILELMVKQGNAEKFESTSLVGKPCLAFRETEAGECMFVQIMFDIAEKGMRNKVSDEVFNFDKQ